MIINGGSRSNGAFFASHLMRADHNERVELRDIRGLLAGNVADALREMEDVASGTQCKNWFYHADINTREDERLTPEQWTAAADALERELGLIGQPRFIVEHEKDGRTHQHIIWSRIDLDRMTAISDSHNYRKHEAVARALEKTFDHTPTPGTLSREYGTERPERGPKDWESFRAQQSRIDPRAIKAELTALWNQADTGRAFGAAVAEQGYILARGDRRDFVIIDRAGDDHSLARQISGVKAAGIRERMADVDRAALPSVAEGREMARQPSDAADSGSDAPPARAVEPRELSGFEAVLAETERRAAPREIRAEAAEPDIAPENAAEHPLPASPFEEILRRTERLAAADVKADPAGEDTAQRFSRWAAWLENMLDSVGQWTQHLVELVAGHFRHDDRDGATREPEQGIER